MRQKVNFDISSLRAAIDVMYAHYLLKKYLNKKYFKQDAKKSKGGKD